MEKQHSKASCLHGDSDYCSSCVHVCMCACRHACVLACMYAWMHVCMRADPRKADPRRQTLEGRLAVALEKLMRMSWNACWCPVCRSSNDLQWPWKAEPRMNCSGPREQTLEKCSCTSNESSSCWLGTAPWRPSCSLHCASPFVLSARI